MKYPKAKVSELAREYEEESTRSRKMVQMSPRDFLNLANPVQGNRENVWDRKKYYEEDYTSLEELKDRMRKDLTLDPLFLMVDYNSKKIVQHNGRHRAFAAMELEIKKVPVMIYFTKAKRGTKICYGDPIEKYNIKMQKFSTREFIPEYY